MAVGVQFPLSSTARDTSGMFSCFFKHNFDNNTPCGFVVALTIRGVTEGSLIDPLNHVSCKCPGFRAAKISQLIH